MSVPRWKNGQQTTTVIDEKQPHEASNSVNAAQISAPAALTSQHTDASSN